MLEDAHLNLDNTVAISFCADVNWRRCRGDYGNFGTCWVELKLKGLLETWTRVCLVPPVYLYFVWRLCNLRFTAIWLILHSHTCWWWCTWFFAGLQFLNFFQKWDGFSVFFLLSLVINLIDDNINVINIICIQVGWSFVYLKPQDHSK